MHLSTSTKVITRKLGKMESITERISISSDEFDDYQQHIISDRDESYEVVSSSVLNTDSNDGKQSDDESEDESIVEVPVRTYWNYNSPMYYYRVCREIEQCSRRIVDEDLCKYLRLWGDYIIRNRATYHEPDITFDAISMILNIPRNAFHHRTFAEFYPDSMLLIMELRDKLLSRNFFI